MSDNAKPWRSLFILQEPFSNHALVREECEKWPDDKNGKPNNQWQHFVEHAALAEAQKRIEELEERLKKYVAQNL